MLTINLSDIVETVEVTIGDHVYNVRRMGSGEELDLSASNNRTFKLMEKATKLQKQFQELSNTPEDQLDDNKVDKLVKSMDEVTQSIRKEQQYQSEAFVRLFDDGLKGEKSRELLKSLASNDKNKLIEKIFDQSAVLKESQDKEES